MQNPTYLKRNAWLQQWWPPLLVMLVIFVFSSIPGEQMGALQDRIDLASHEISGIPTSTVTPSPTLRPTRTPRPTITRTATPLTGASPVKGATPIPGATPTRAAAPAPAPTRSPAPTPTATPLPPIWQPVLEYWGWLKYGHVFWYAVLGLAFRYSFAKKYPAHKAALYALLACAVYAGLDEIHQSFVPGRDPLLLDVCLDTGTAAFVLQVRVWLAGWRSDPRA